jgi:hypothetical protein
VSYDPVRGARGQITLILVSFQQFGARSEAEHRCDSGCEKRVRGNGNDKKKDVVPGKEGERRADQTSDYFSFSIVDGVCP